jgi:hypothetical protein
VHKKGENTMKRTKFSFILSFLLLMLITVTAFSGCGNNERNNNEENNGFEEVEEAGGLGTDAEDSMAVFPHIGEGENTFLFEVVTDEEMSYFWVVHTNYTTVGDALLEHDLVRGNTGDFGFFVTEINGLVADFEANGAFWAFYIDGDFAVTGVMETEIESDTIYAFVYTR